ncbi:unnamed protein product [Acanthoscelides obtectus]|nr:unnamed protein product [Acanthoscelides obtectus]CAK1625160.1 Probable multidrug resistance-associated protein lethal(2)03659 [Acanthoscelides obtectus]
MSETLADRLERNWNNELRNKDCKTKPSLNRAIFKTFYKRYIFIGILQFFHCMCIRMLQPILLAEYIRYYEAGKDKEDSQLGWILSSLIVVTAFLNILIAHFNTLSCYRIGMRVRVACCSLIYRKLLKLSQASLTQTTAGQLVNLLSNDVQRFDNASIYLHYIWIMPFHFVLAFYILFQSVGLAAIAGMTMIGLQAIPLQGFLSRLQGKLRYKIALRTDHRIKLMSEIISGIQVIKLYAWELPFQKVVELARKLELDVITKTSYIKGMSTGMMVFTERLILYVTLVTHVFLGNHLTGDIVFSLAQIFNIVQHYVAFSFPNAIATYSEARVSVQRIEKFLLLEETTENEVQLDEIWKPNGLENKTKTGNLKTDKSRNDVIKQDDLNNEEIAKSNAVDNNTKEAPTDSNNITAKDSQTEVKNNQNQQNSTAIIQLDDCNASWVGQDTLALENLNLIVKPGSLCCVVGNVGAGKSSLLHLLLKEMPVASGNAEIKGNVSYASQEPWLFNSTIRDNILFGKPYSQDRYDIVVRVCALEADLDQLPSGDKTLVGERGAILSGGQRARVNLARAVYAEDDIYLLDDPLSAVDTHVGKHLFQECIKKFLKDKTRILVTHQLQFLKEADQIVLMKEGKIMEVGKFDTIENLLCFAENNETDTDSNITKKEKPDQELERSVHLDSYVGPNADKDAEEEDELIEKGAIPTSTYLEYCRAGTGVAVLILLIILLMMAQMASNACDLWLRHWTNNEEIRALHAHRQYLNNNTLTFEDNTTLAYIVTDNETEPLSYDDDPVVIYLEIDEKTRNMYIIVYTFCILLSIILTSVRSLLYYKVCMNTSKALHNNMFACILQAPMRFFDTNPSGRILNRFSKDMGAIDELLPTAALDAIQICLVLFGILTMVFVVVPLMIVPALVLSVLFYFCRSIYLASAQDIKRLEGITKAPVFSHTSSTLYGLTTIRSSKAERIITKEFDTLQDQHTSTWFLYLASSEAFGFYLDMISTVFLAFVTFQFLVFQSGFTLSGNVGLVISQSLILAGMLQFGIRQSAEVANNMVSVERVLQYTKLDKEDSFQSINRTNVDKSWPHQGKILFKNVYLRYAADEMPVLKNLNLEIRPKEKIGVVGRTGAGKSSLIAALFRLAPLEGTISIDDVDTSTVDLKLLRTKMSIIPQEPVLFSATVRYNLDPFDAYDDATLWNALENVKLKSYIKDLSQEVNEGGSNFSVGQKQLICLARAIIRNNKILVLDEATANIDENTDQLVQAAIRSNFCECTVLTIAHRLNTITDSDRVLVMHDGQAVEFGPPSELLANQEGVFARMVREAGPEAEAAIRQAAQEAALKRTRQNQDDAC